MLVIRCCVQIGIQARTAVYTVGQPAYDAEASLHLSKCNGVGVVWTPIPSLAYAIAALQHDSAYYYGMSRCSKFRADLQLAHSLSEIWGCFRPIERSFVTDWDAMEQVWRHTFRNVLQNAPSEVRRDLALCRELQCPCSCPPCGTVAIR